MSDLYKIVKYSIPLMMSGGIEIGIYHSLQLMDDLWVPTAATSVQILYKDLDYVTALRIQHSLNEVN